MIRNVFFALFVFILSLAAAKAQTEAEAPSEAAPVIRPSSSPRQQQQRPSGARRVVKRAAVPQRVEQLWGLGGTSFSTDYLIRVRQVETRLQGSQVGVTGFWDRYLRGHFKARISLGLDQVNSSGKIQMPPGCSGTSQCFLKLNFLHAQGEVWAGIFNYEKAPVNFGVTGGVAGLLPLSKSSDALETETLSGVAGLTGGGFFEIRLTPGYWLWAQYQALRFAQSESVKLEASRAMLGVSFEL